ncbi:nitroreductase family deazaflavin-dependent oxidoreductase [Nocardioides humilatus]|uniref:Nitroreductase family deazaflavin-dependent oxidoreductase n=1 Tax=Nocardioides humilatus TaxID=2607660 RepID=A0A5B1L418_9ACTN|nr:nitroreductase/quinone reductase family protein [Nocardioides humilatus]KAA1415431.1 nitroreductase family deazaflavin-dependent oxidoreductase [Nocardioides humilatus]
MSLYTRMLQWHGKVYERTNGRLGHRLLGVPTILLRTKGRKSGLERISALVYARDGADVLIVASNHGGDKPPAWLFNLEADPAINYQLGRKRQEATARAVYPDQAGYERLMKICDDSNSGRYTRYRAKTDRPIPVVVLTPA